jgi:acetolactate synthase-1/2/3 large subunit
VLCSGAGFEQVRSPETAQDDLLRAIRTAVLERKPVVLNLPADFQLKDVGTYPTVPPKFVTAQALHPAVDDFDVALGIIISARRPVIVAGGGASTPAARAALLRLADRIQAPVATSLRGKDLFRGTPHDLGIFGGLSHEVANDVISRADTVIAFGVALNRWTAAEGSLLKDKALVHVDAERRALDQWYHADAALVGDAAAIANNIVELLDEAEISGSGYATADMAQRLADRRDDTTFRDQSTPTTVDVRSALLRIDEGFPRDRTLVTDAGRFVVGAFSMVHVPDPSAFVYTMNFGSIGLGMGNAIGAYVGAPQRPVLMLCGDGGFMLGGLAEFSTAVRHRIDLVVIVFNDDAYGAEHVQFRVRDMDPSNSTFDWPELAPIADALGGQGFTVRTLDELDQTLKAVHARDRPVLIDVKLDPDKVPDLRP